jgi:hypothetical protein
MPITATRPDPWSPAKIEEPSYMINKGLYRLIHFLLTLYKNFVINNVTGATWLFGCGPHSGFERQLSAHFLVDPFKVFANT